MHMQASLSYAMRLLLLALRLPLLTRFCAVLKRHACDLGGSQHAAAEHASSRTRGDCVCVDASRCWSLHCWACTLPSAALLLQLLRELRALLLRRHSSAVIFASQQSERRLRSGKISAGQGYVTFLLPRSKSAELRRATRKLDHPEGESAGPRSAPPPHNRLAVCGDRPLCLAWDESRAQGERGEAFGRNQLSANDFGRAQRVGQLCREGGGERERQSHAVSSTEAPARLRMRTNSVRTLRRIVVCGGRNVRALARHGQDGSGKLCTCSVRLSVPRTRWGVSEAPGVAIRKKPCDTQARILHRALFSGPSIAHQGSMVTRIGVDAEACVRNRAVPRRHCP